MTKIKEKSLLWIGKSIMAGTWILIALIQVLVIFAPAILLVIFALFFL